MTSTRHAQITGQMIAFSHTHDGTGPVTKMEAIQVAMTYRPNQNPLINALKDTIAYQAKIKGQMEILQQAQSQQNANSAVMGAGQMPGAGNPVMPGMSAGAPPVAEVPTAPVPVTP